MEDLFFEQECNAELLEMQKRKCKMRYISNLRYFKQGCTQHYLESIADDLEPVFFGQNRTIVKEGTKFTHILMIFSGTANFWRNDMHSDNEYFESDGGVIGEIEFAEKKDLYDFTTEAVSNVCAYKLHASAAKKYFETYSLQWFEMKLSAEQRRNQILQIQSNSKPDGRSEPIRRISSAGDLSTIGSNDWDLDLTPERSKTHRASESMPLPNSPAADKFESRDWLPDLVSEKNAQNRMEMPQRRRRGRAISTPLQPSGATMVDHSGFQIMRSTEDWRPRPRTGEDPRSSISPEGSVMQTRRLARKESSESRRDSSSSPSSPNSAHHHKHLPRYRRRRVSGERLSLDDGLASLLRSACEVEEVVEEEEGSPAATSPAHSVPEGSPSRFRRPRRISSETQMVGKGLPPRPKPPADSRIKGENMVRSRTFNLKVQIPPSIGT